MKYKVSRLFMFGSICFLFLIFSSEKNALADSWPEKTKNWVWPVEGVITDTYGTRGGHHKGIDIAAEIGTPIHSVDSGVVTRSYYSDTYGNVVFIQHHNDTETIYAHLKKRLVFEGEVISAGDTIGEMGNTGDSSGVHLHFEVHANEWTFSKENALDPFLVFNHDEDTILVSGKMNGPYMDTYEVKTGDTLWSISERYNVTVAELVNKNGLRSENIYPNQILQVP
ncbi:peptidoglycan DD-metalloendopeptidase family protein [Cytobacillus sp. FSL K6-0129]|uniref:peptidoglycan DD-metalloendopeptidase family protein n=2 Tax=Cytobacillus sp. FSL K6-0129 TaxID=2921421 RepID=UPI0030F5E545